MGSDSSKRSKTLRLILPQWQGGTDIAYAFGAELLAFIAPNNAAEETVRITVDMEVKDNIKAEDPIAYEEEILSQLISTTQVLEEKRPDKVIVFGGDCAISQAPFDYLSGKYGDKLGVIWFDAHPDISTTESSQHAHEMVLSNVIGHGESALTKQIKHPVSKERVIYAGLIERDLREKDSGVRKLNMQVVGPDLLKLNSDHVLEWIQKEKITKLAVHFDLDVLTPECFRSNTCAKPYMTREEYGSAIGELSFDDIVRVLQDAGASAEIVGLCIAEHMPWDAFNLREALAKISIFR